MRAILTKSPSSFVSMTFFRCLRNAVPNVIKVSVTFAVRSISIWAAHSVLEGFTYFCPWKNVVKERKFRIGPLFNTISHYCINMCIFLPANICTISCQMISKRSHEEACLKFKNFVTCMWITTLSTAVDGNIICLRKSRDHELNQNWKILVTVTTKFVMNRKHVRHIFLILFLV